MTTPEASQRTDHGRVAVITGGGAGIGRASAVRLARNGVRVVIVDIDGGRAASAAEDISERTGTPATGLTADLSDPASIKELFQVFEARFDRLDILVNNAGLGTLASFSETSLNLWNRTLAVNLTGPLLMTQAASAHMIREGWGRIVNIASTSGIRAGINRTAYGTSKTALTGLTRQTAVELAGHGITANAVAPGPIATEMAEGSHSAAMRRAYEEIIPMGRYGDADEVAAAVEFLCSESASFITGQVLAVDGGFVAAGNLRG